MTIEDLKREMRVYHEAVMANIEQDKAIPDIVEKLTEKIGEDKEGQMAKTIDDLCLRFRESGRQQRDKAAQGKMMAMFLRLMCGDKDALADLGGAK